MNFEHYYLINQWIPLKLNKVAPDWEASVNNVVVRLLSVKFIVIKNTKTKNNIPNIKIIQ